ncbi:hypothetical protein EVAR_39728_1 [Eumeta japonica]|uniref:Uncharacterized protein n=1 Tax=Eumeta variegata TaxID=151549 RepID=A0A4C1W614_EUMVA|nr:hypothetical protein EVAR_39728_1 [Eumeta japonica]
MVPRIPSRPKGCSLKGTRQSRHYNPGQWRGRREGSDLHRRKRHSYFNKSQKLQDWRCVGVIRRGQAHRPVPRSHAVYLLKTRNGQINPGRSVLDVTTCNSALLDKAKELQVV